MLLGALPLSYVLHKIIGEDNGIRTHITRLIGDNPSQTARVELNREQINAVRSLGS
jgi:hypothetical protein